MIVVLSTLKPPQRLICPHHQNGCSVLAMCHLLCYVIQQAVTWSTLPAGSSPPPALSFLLNLPTAWITSPRKKWWAPFRRKLGTREIGKRRIYPPLAFVQEMYRKRFSCSALVVLSFSSFGNLLNIFKCLALLIRKIESMSFPLRELQTHFLTESQTVLEASQHDVSNILETVTLV